MTVNPAYGYPRWFYVAVIAFLLIACGGAEQRAGKHLERGAALYEEGDYVKARLEFKNVLQIQPKNVEALYLLGQTAEKLRDWQTAFGSYTRILREDSEHVPARLRRGNLFVLGNAPDEGLGEAMHVLHREPGNLDARLLKGAALLRKKDYVSAREVVGTAIALAPENEDAIVLAALVESGEGKDDQAEHILRSALSRSTGSKDLRIALLSVLERARQHQAAVATLRELIQQDPSSVPYQLKLAELYAKSGRIDEAEAALRSALQLGPEEEQVKLALVNFLAKNREGQEAERQLLAFLDDAPGSQELRFGLAKLYLGSERSEQAKDVLRGMADSAEAGPYRARAAKALAIQLYNEGRLAEAAPLVEQVLQDARGDAEALLLKGQIELDQRQLDAAVSDIRAALRSEPDSESALRLLAGAHLIRREWDLAKEALEQAIDSNPEGSMAYLGLAKIHIDSGDEVGAISVLRRLLQKVPDNQIALQELARLEIHQRNWLEASRVARRLQERYPDKPQGFYLIGIVYESQRDLSAAQASYKMAHDRAENAAEPLIALTRVLIEQDRQADALAMLGAILEKDATNALAHNLAGGVYQQQGNDGAAEAAFRRGIEASEMGAASYSSLAKLYMSQGRAKDAVEVYRQGISASERDKGLRVQLSVLLNRLGRHREAMEELEEILKEDPGYIAAANNLAMLLADHQNDEAGLERALQLSRAFETTRNPGLRDTIGWVRYRRGEYGRAAELFDEILKDAPDVPEFNYHAGMVYLEAGRTRDAKHSLGKAVTANREFSGIEEAREALESL